MLKSLSLLILSILYFNFNIISQSNNQQDNLITFYFQDKKLLDLVYEIAKAKNINIIPPQLASQIQELNSQTVTYKPKIQEITLDQAWKFLLMFLEMSGYSLIQKDENNYTIALNSTLREPLDLYVDTDLDSLPNEPKRIRYIAYLKNINISQINKDNNNALAQIFKDMLTTGSPEPIYLPSTNGFILTDRSDIISSIMNIISKLDETGFREAIEYLPINYVSSQEVSQVLNTLRKAVKTNDTSFSIRADDQGNQINYFGADLEIISDTRQNALIIMGREQAVNVISKFIKDYVDLPANLGKSILHYYELQYLDAKEFAPILQDIVTTQNQNKQSEQAYQMGPLRFFNGVIVKAEANVKGTTIATPISASDPSANKISNFEPKGIQAQILTGGNRLIILALDDDWQQIQKLIKKLDIPQPQALLDILVLDITVNNIRQLQSTVRTRTDASLMPSKGTQFLSSNISPPGNVLGTDPQQIAQDLLAFVGPNSIPALAPPGALLITYNDRKTPGIAGIVQALSQYTQAQIKTHPFLVVLNNKKGNISQEIRQRNRGDSVQGPNGSFIIPIENISARIKLSCIPHIIDENKLKLDIGVNIEDFIATTLNKTTRGMFTTVNLSDNQILAIGGLNQKIRTNVFTRTPLIGDIPIIGNLFRGERLQVLSTSIIILVKPKIIMPKKNQQQISLSSNYTKDKLDNILAAINNNIFYNFTDPVVKLFLSDEQNMIDNFDLLDEYLEQTNNLNSESEKSNLILNPKNNEKINFNNVKEVLNKEEKSFFKNAKIQN